MNRQDFVRDGQRLSVTLRAGSTGSYQVTIGNSVKSVDAWTLPDGRVRFRLDGVVWTVDALRCSKSWQVRLAGRTWSLPHFEGGRTASGSTTGVVEAPMTGTIVRVLVKAGTAVEIGAPLVVLSAMKMEHNLTAGIAGLVAELRAEVGQTIEQGTVVARIEPRVGDQTVGTP